MRTGCSTAVNVISLSPRRGTSTTTFQGPWSPSNRAPTSLLRWDSESLTGLLALHRGVAAALLRSQRTRAPQSPPGECRRPEPSSNGCRDRPQQPQRLSDNTAFKQAEESLTIALAIAGEENITRPYTSGASPLGPGFSCTAGSRGRNNRRTTLGDKRATAKRSSSRTHRGAPAEGEATAVGAGAGGGRLETMLPLTPNAPRGVLSNTSTSSPSSEAPISGSSSSGLPPPASSQSTASAPGVAVNSDIVVIAAPATSSDAIAELYAMRCTARERLGFTRAAFEDVREGVRLAPRAVKLWAKAASLALRMECGAAGSERRRGGLDGVEEGTTAARLSGALAVSVVGAKTITSKLGAAFLLCVCLSPFCFFTKVW